jgi:hypothetical protein
LAAIEEQRAANFKLRHHEIVGNLTLADAIIDRVIHNAYWIELADELH